MRTLLRAAVSLSILAVIFSRSSLDDLLARARSAALLPLASALLLVVLMALLVALRWHWLARWMGLALPVGLAVRAMFLGLFGGQVLPSAIGTDLLRGSVVARHTGRLRTVTASLVVDRLVALFAACLLLASSYPSLSQIPLPLVRLIVPSAALVSGAALLVFLLACAGKLTPVILAAIAVAVAIHGIAILAAALTASAYGVAASFVVWFSIVPMSIIASAIPISLNGWGVRESVIVALAAWQGIAPADALIVSMTLGVLNVLASLPGAYLLMREPRGTA